MFCTFEGAGNEFGGNRDEREIKLNIEINLNGIKSKNIGVNHNTPFSKVLTSNARKFKGRLITSNFEDTYVY